MPILVDANVWLPILVERHEHHQAASAWWDNCDPVAACWCRPVQQTVLRLLSNPRVMGDDLLSPDEAWRIWEELTLDKRTAFLPLEPRGLEPAWRENIRDRAPTPKLWMDAYLAAWAEAAGLTMATFDSGFQNYPRIQMHLLSPHS